MGEEDEVDYTLVGVDYDKIATRILATSTSKKQPEQVATWYYSNGEPIGVRGDSGEAWHYSTTDWQSSFKPTDLSKIEDDSLRQLAERIDVRRVALGRELTPLEVVDEVREDQWVPQEEVDRVKIETRDALARVRQLEAEAQEAKDAILVLEDGLKEAQAETPIEECRVERYTTSTGKVMEVIIRPDGWSKRTVIYDPGYGTGTTSTNPLGGSYVSERSQWR